MRNKDKSQAITVHTTSHMESGVKRFGAVMLKFGGGLFGIPGLIAMGAGLAQLLENQQDFDALSVGAALVIIGAILWKGSQRLEQAAQLVGYRRTQNKVIQLARQKGGRLTVTETAADSGIVIEEAERILKGLADQGYVELEVTESGMMVYRFPEVLFAHEKQWSRSIDRA